MNIEQVHRNARLRDMLASEYTLGTLRGGARRRFEQWLCSDAALRACVAQWQDRLQAMAELAPATQPSPHVWQKIERQLAPRAGREASAARAFLHPLFASLRFWRGLALTSAAFTVIFATVMLGKAPVPAAPSMSSIATLTDNGSRVSAVIVGDAMHGRMTVKILAPLSVNADQSMELWAIPANGAPRSLGLVAANGAVVLPLPGNTTPESVPTLAISLEPKGGSPDPNGPTGPILFKGAWVKI